MERDESAYLQHLLAGLTAATFATVLVILNADAVASMIVKEAGTGVRITNWHLTGAMAVMAIGLPIQVSAWYVVRYFGIRRLTTFGRVWLGIALSILPVGFCALLLYHSLWITFLFVGSVYGSGFAFAGGWCVQDFPGWRGRKRGEKAAGES